MDPNVPISEIMSTDLVTITSKTPLAEIEEVFRVHDFHQLPVIDNEKLVGIVSKTDYLQIQHVLTYDWSGRSRVDESYNVFTAADIMTEQPTGLDPDDTIGLAVDIFLATKFHALPVVDVDKVVGIVTSHDLMAFAFKSPAPSKYPTDLNIDTNV